MNIVIFTLALIILVLVFAFLTRKKQSIPTLRKPKLRDVSSLETSLTNVSNQISSYLGFDPTGGFAPYNSTTFQQYLGDAIQSANQEQSSGSFSPQFWQYLINLLKGVQAVSPLNAGSFDQEHLGRISGAIFICVLALQNGIEWEPEDSSLIQDVEHTVDLYEDWLSGKKSSTDAGSYLNDPLVYNLKMDADAGYPTGTVQVLDEITAAAIADAWYLSNNNMSKARVWYDLGMFDGFKCVYTADGNTC